jgi:osmotically-inducible protein OsmY
MNKFDFNIGAAVHCKNGPCGKMKKLVVDSESLEVTDLIVEKGLIHTEDWVVPFSDVDRATEDYVMLSINCIELEDYPEYRSYDFDAIGQKLKNKAIESTYIVPPVSPYGLDPAGRFIPIIHSQSVHVNVRPEQEVITRGTPVHNKRKKIGSVDHILVDPESGKLTHLVVDPGLFTNSVVLHVSKVERVNENGILVNVDEREIDQFPEYSPRDDNAIITDLRERLKEESIINGIDISVDNNILTMRGSVPDIQTKRRLEYVARTMVGVLEVENNLHPENVADSKVLAALSNDPRTEFSVIEVIEDRNQVTLRGQVDSVEILQAAFEIADAQTGVLRVINGLSVKEDCFSPAFVTRITKILLKP